MAQRVIPTSLLAHWDLITSSSSASQSSGPQPLSSPNTYFNWNGVEFVDEVSVSSTIDGVCRYVPKDFFPSKSYEGMNLTSSSPSLPLNTSSEVRSNLYNIASYATSIGIELASCGCSEPKPPTPPYAPVPPRCSREFENFVRAVVVSRELGFDVLGGVKGEKEGGLLPVMNRLKECVEEGGGQSP